MNRCRMTFATSARGRRWRSLEKQAAKLKVSLNIENIFFNGYLMTPMEMNAFVDSFQSEHVRVHFDTGNISMFQFAEHWVPILGKRIQNIHFKEFTKKGTDYSLETFRPLLDGTTNWPAVMDALGCGGLPRLRDLRVFPSVSALPGGVHLPDERLAGSHPRPGNSAARIIARIRVRVVAGFAVVRW